MNNGYVDFNERYNEKSNEGFYEAIEESAEGTANLLRGPLKTSKGVNGNGSVKPFFASIYCKNRVFRDCLKKLRV